MLVQNHNWGVIRKTEGREWYSTIQPIREMAESQAETENRQCGVEWAKVNPVQRIVRVEIKEIF